MCKIDLRLLILIACMSIELHAADALIDGLKVTGEVIQAAKPVVDAALPLMKEGAQAVGEGVQKVKQHHHKSSKKPTLEDLAATVQAQGKALEELRGIMETSSKQHDAFVKKQVANVKVPTSKNPRGFVTEEKLQAAVQGFVTQDDLQKATAGAAIEDPANPFVKEDNLKKTVAGLAVDDQLKKDVQNLQASLGSRVTQQQLTDATAGAIKHNDLHGYITKDDVRDGVKYAAGQFALGFSSYRLSWMIASLLQSARMENKYIDLRDVSVPLTTLMASFAVRASKEIYQTQKVSNLQAIAQKSLQDTVSSGIVIALKNICFDTEMDAYWNECSENRKAGLYAVAVVPVSLIVNLFAH